MTKLFFSSCKRAVCDGYSTHTTLQRSGQKSGRHFLSVAWWFYLPFGCFVHLPRTDEQANPQAQCVVLWCVGMRLKTAYTYFLNLSRDTLTMESNHTTIYTTFFCSRLYNCLIVCATFMEGTCGAGSVTTLPRYLRYIPSELVLHLIQVMSLRSALLRNAHVNITTTLLGNQLNETARLWRVF
jgi:hypothetical protein